MNESDFFTDIVGACYVIGFVYYNIGTYDLTKRLLRAYVESGMHPKDAIDSAMKFDRRLEDSTCAKIASFFNSGGREIAYIQFRLKHKLK